jgi:hypothetical protein
MAICRVSAWDEVDEFIMSNPSPEQIISFQMSAALQERAVELLKQNREGELTLEELTELDEFTAIEKFMRRLKAKALAKHSQLP